MSGLRTSSETKAGDCGILRAFGIDEPVTYKSNTCTVLGKSASSPPIVRVEEVKMGLRVLMPPAVRMSTSESVDRRPLRRGEVRQY